MQSTVFATLTGALVLVLRIIQELWQSSGGVFNVDEVLQQMVFGLEEELELRSQQAPWIDPQSANAASSSSGPYGGMVPLPPYLSTMYQQQQPQPQQQLPLVPPAPDYGVPRERDASPPSGGIAWWRRGGGGGGAEAAQEHDAASESGAMGAEEAEEAYEDVLEDAHDDDVAHDEVLPPSSKSALQIVEDYRLPRPQRAFLGRVARAMMEGIQVIGKSQ